MRASSYLIILLFCTNFVYSQEFNPTVKGNYENLPFKEFVKILEEEKGIRSFYREEWVKDIRINVLNDSISLKNLLARNIYPHNLTYSLIPPDRLYLLQNKRLTSELPVFIPSGQEELYREEKEALTATEQKYLQGRKPDMLETIIVGNKTGSFSKRPVTVQGRVTNLETGEPVTGATMVILENGKGSITDANGIVSMAVLPGRYKVNFSFIGLKNVDAWIEIYEAGSFSIEMEPEVIAITEVQIVGNDYRKVKGTEMGLERINVSSIKQLPVLMGERDIIKISTLLPGIVTVSEASSGLNVRGGNADQNLFYIEEIPLFNTSHSFGFFSAFNSDIVRDFSVYKGNIPAKYGGRLSSVFDVTTRKGSLKKYTAHAGVSPISAFLTLEGPLKKEKGSILLSGRTSYSDWLLNRMEDPLLRNSNASFYDLSGSLFFKLNEKNDLNVFFYNSNDKIGLHELNNYEYQNLGASAKWSHQFSPSFRSELSLIHSDYTFETENFSIPSTGYKHKYNISHNELKLNFNLLKGLKHEIDFGASVIYYPLNRGRVIPLEESFRREIDLGDERGLQTGIYISDKLSLTDWLTIYAGVRLNTFTYLGPAEVNSYFEGTEKLEENISGVNTYEPWEPVVTYTDPSVRSGINLKLAPNTSLKLSFSQMNQYLYMTSNTVSLAPDDQWKLADYYLKPQKSYQYSAGIYQYLSSLDVNASVEFYRKDNSNILEYKDGADFINIPDAEISILQGDQRIHGLEFMLEKKSGRFDGWLSYTYSRSLVTVDGKNSWEQINGGEAYPSNYDKPHVLNFVGTYRINRMFVFSSTVVYSTGRPITLPESLYFIDGNPYISFGSRNSARVSDYFRTDLSLTIEGNLRRDKLFHSTWIFNVYNLTGRNNPQSIFFRTEGSNIQGYELSIIGVPIFTVTWTVKLGNYAAK